MEWLSSIDFTDPFMLVIYAPVVLGIAYAVFTVWGRSGD